VAHALLAGQRAYAAGGAEGGSGGHGSSNSSSGGSHEDESGLNSPGVPVGNRIT
jgi:hypothetical protein